MGVDGLLARIRTQAAERAIRITDDAREKMEAEVCDVCGDVLFTPETIERLEALRRTTKAPVRMGPLYRLAESA